MQKKNFFPYSADFAVGAVICGLYYNASGLLDHGDACFLGISLSAVRFRYMFALNCSDAELGPLWYMRTLFFFVLISPMLKKFANLAGLLGLALLHFCTSPYPMLDGIVPRSFGGGIFIMGILSATGLFWFVFGMFLRLNITVAESCCDSKMLGCLICFFFVVLRALAVCLNWNATVQMCLGFVTIPIALFAVWQLVPATRWPVWLTGGSIAIYLMHMFVVRTAEIVGMSQSWPLVTAFLGVCIPIIVNVMLRRSSPTIAAALLGGR